MGKDILTRDELVDGSGVAEIELDLWAKAKILKPVGYADDGAPFYPAEDLPRAKHIRKLVELGYGLEEIQKIIKKFGLPKAEGEKDRAAAGKLLTVGQLAERTGLSPRTIKHWEEMGIIDPEMRSGGGFRLYDEAFIFFCELIRDLQLFGYTLEEIKDVSGYFRDFLALQKDLSSLPKAEAGRKLEEMHLALAALDEKMALLRKGIGRWEDLLKKKKKEIAALKSRNEKRPSAGTENADA